MSRLQPYLMGQVYMYTDDGSIEVRIEDCDSGVTFSIVEHTPANAFEKIKIKVTREMLACLGSMLTRVSKDSKKEWDVCDGDRAEIVA